MAVHDFIKETLAAHKREVLFFNGNGYSDECGWLRLRGEDSKHPLHGGCHPGPDNG